MSYKFQGRPFRNYKVKSNKYKIKKVFKLKPINFKYKIFERNK